MSFGMAYATKKRNKKCMAKGGKVESDLDHGSKRGPEGYSKYQEQAQNQKGVHTPVSGVTQFPGGKGTSRAGDYAKDRYAGKAIMNDSAKAEHHKVLGEMRSMKKPNLMAEGGEVEEMGEYDPMEHPVPEDNEAANMEDADMIARIMHSRKKYSKGGQVANDVGIAEADEKPAEYDDLVLDDNLEDDSGAGNEHGDAAQHERDMDVVAKIISSRKKKDKLPRPA